MKIAVVGCGAMGSIYAALLVSAQHDVLVVDRNSAHIEAINSSGLRVWGASGDRTVRPRAFLSAPSEPVDLIICAVKSRFVASAADSMTPMLAPQTSVLTIQNGLGSADIIAEQVGADRLIVGVAQGFGASLAAPGTVHHNDMKAIRMGAYANLAPARVEEIATIWASAGFDAAAVANIASMQWGKLICNVAYSGPCAVTGLTLGEVLVHPQMRLISRDAAREAYAVAQALKVDLPFDNPDQEIYDFAKRMPKAKPSVLLDIEAGNISEVDFINGAVPKQGERVGLLAPVNAALTALVQSLEAQDLREK